MHTLMHRYAHAHIHLYIHTYMPVHSLTGATALPTASSHTPAAFSVQKQQLGFETCLSPTPRQLPVFIISWISTPVQTSHQPLQPPFRHTQPTPPHCGPSHLQSRPVRPLGGPPCGTLPGWRVRVFLSLPCCPEHPDLQLHGFLHSLLSHHQVKVFLPFLSS